MLRMSKTIGAIDLTRASTAPVSQVVQPRFDAPVKSIAPMVFDILNMVPQLEHQKKAWGKVSYKIDDYTELDLPNKLGTERGKQLTAMVDPFRYRRRLTMPKLILLGTNDHYWPLDALNLYWRELQGPKYILYVPNNRHDLQDLVRVSGSICALHRSAVTGVPLPELKWNFAGLPGGTTLRLESDTPPTKVLAWVATSDQRDFRKATWKSFPVSKNGKAYQYRLTTNGERFTAMFAEAQFAGESLPYFLSTNVKIIESSPE